MSSEVSQIYANALFSAAKDEGDSVLQETRSDLRQTALLFQLNPDLTRLLQLPTLSVEERQGIAKKIFGDDGLSSRLLQILIVNGRVGFVGEIADAFDAQMLDYQNTVQVTVTTAVALTPDQKERLRAALEHRLAKSVRITEHIDRSVLGGVIVQYGDTRIDNSVKYRLETLRERLTQ